MPTRKRSSRKANVTFSDVIRSIPLIADDMFLGMQALNLAVVDGYLRSMESELLALLIERETTPIPDSIVVSALSQLWIFGLYELLRTWRQRTSQLLTFEQETARLAGQELLSRLAEEERRIVERSPDRSYSKLYAKQFRKVAQQKTYASRLRSAYFHSELPFRRLEALRVHLAKHEMPKQKGSFGLDPGYGRIDMLNGSIYWQVPLGRNEVDIVSRQSIADACAQILSRLLTKSGGEESTNRNSRGTQQADEVKHHDGRIRSAA